MRSKLGILLWFASLLFLLHFSAAHSTHKSQKVTSPFGLNVPKIVRNIFHLGHHRLYEDYLFIWSIQEVTSPAKKGRDGDKVLKVFQEIAQEQIQIEPYYMMTCFYMNTAYQKPENCARVTHEGLKAFPGSWRIAMTQGYIEAYRLHNHLAGAAMYKLASQNPRAPAWVGRLADKLIQTKEHTPEDYDTILRLMKNIPGFLDQNFLPRQPH